MAWKNFLLNRMFGKIAKNVANQPNRNPGRRHKAKLGIETLEDRVVPANFTPGNLAILQAAASASNTTASIIELSPTTPASNPVQTIAIPSTGANAIEISGSATSTGYVSNSNDGSYVEFNGANSTATGNVNTLNPRAVVALNNAATVTLPTTYTGTSGNQTRAATSLDDTNWFIGDQGGIYTNGAMAASPTGNVRATKSFGGTVYVGENSTTAGVVPMYTVAIPSGGTLTALPGFTTNDSTFQDYYLVSSGTNGSTFDELYTLDETSVTAGTVNKFSLVSGTWTANGSYATNFGGFGLAAAPDGSGGTFLYASTGTGATTANKVMKLDDTAGFNTTIAITTGNNVTLYTAAAGTIVKGVAFAPVVDTGTTTAITSVSPLTASTTQNITFTATVSVASGSAPTGGTLVFRNGPSGALLATATSPTTNGSTATFTVSTTVAAGSYSNIQAFYISNVGSGFSSSLSSVYGSTLTVGTSTATAITSITPLSGTTATSYTFTATVTASSGSTAPGAGSVAFYNNSTLLATATSEMTSGLVGTFTVSSTSVPAGTYSNITAIYTPSTGFTTSTSSAYGSTLMVTTPGIIAQWSFTGTVAAPDNSPAPTQGGGTLTTLGMTNDYAGHTGDTASDDILVTAGTANTGYSESTLRVRGTPNNGWATYQGGAGAPQYSQGIELDTSTVGQSNIVFAFDWYSTTQGIRDLQVQYNTGSGWVNYQGPSPTGTFVSAGNDYYNAALSPVNPTIYVDLTGVAAANNNADLGIRLVSAFDSTGTLGMEYASAASTPGSIVAYNNTSGNWRFDNMTFYSGITTSTVVTASPTSPQAQGTNVTFTATVTPASGAAFPSGTVAFYDGKTMIGTTQTVTQVGSSNVGTASISLSTLAIGTHGDITAQYVPTVGNNMIASGSSMNLSTGVDPISYTITGLTTTSVVTASPPSPQALGTPVTFTDTITPSMGTAFPTGTVNFFDGSTQIGATQTVTQVGSTNQGMAAITISTLTAGTHSITAQYLATGSFNGSTSPAIGYTIAAGAGGAFTPGDLVVLQAGDGVNSYSQAPVYLNEITSTGTSVQQIAIPSVAGSGATGVSAASENGTTVTITTSTTALYAVGETITLSGITPTAWDITAPVATVISPTQFTIQAPANLPAITSLTGAVATPPNQALTIELQAANANGQLNRSYDGSALTLDGVDSTTTATSTGATAYSTAGRDLAVISGNPNIASDINTATYGAWNGGDDNRTSIAESAYGPIYQVGHNNDVSGFPSYVGVHVFSTEGGPSLGTQVSAASNIRGVTIGPDNRMYFITASGLSSVGNVAGIFTDAAALPASGSTTPSTDVMVVPYFKNNAKLNGAFIADMNGTGVISNGDRLYFLDGDSATGAGGGGLYVATWNTSNNYPWDTPNNAGAAAAGIVDYWGIPVRLGDAPVQSGSTNIGQLVGITGTVLSLNSGNTPGTVELYTSAFDAAASDSSIIQQWMDSGSGVTITSAAVSGSTVTITTASPTNFTNGEWVTVNGLGNNGGSSYSVGGMTISLVTGGDNGTFQVNVVNSTTFTYTDTNSGLVSVTNASGVGSADAAITSDLSQASTYQTFGIGINNNNNGNYNGLAETFGGTIIQTLAGGVDGTLTTKPEVGLRGVAFAPVAATTVTLANSGGTLTATLSNSQVTPGGQVAFINENTGAVLGFGTISSSAPYTATLSASTVIGNAYVEAYFAGGGAQALAPAQSNVIQVQNAGTTTDSVTVSPSLAAVAVNTPVTLTATVTPASGPTGNVSFYNTTGGVQPSLANLIGTAGLSGNTAALTTAFAVVGTQTITAVYNGDSTYQSSSSTTTVNVALNATAAITSPTNPAPINTAPTYTVTLTGNATLSTPTGSVTVTIVSATVNSSGQPAITTTSASITLTAGSGNTATAVWDSTNATPPPSLTKGGSYLVTMTYTPASGSGYSGFSITPKASGANYTNTALIENVNKAFTPGNLVLVQRGDGSLNTGSSGGLVELDEYTPTGTEVQSIILPNSPTGSNLPFVVGSQNGSLGLINRSANGAYLTLIGNDTPLGTQFLTSSFPYVIPRTIAEVGSGGAGAVNTTTAITSTSPTAVPFEQEAVVSYDGNQFWIVSSLPTGDATDSGIEYVSSVGATTATQLTTGGTTGTAINIAGGQLYVTGGSGNINAVGSGLQTTATQTLTGLPNLQNEYQNYYTSNRSPEQVLLLNTTDGTTNNPNVAYVADQDFGLLKFYLNNAAISLSSSGTTATATVTSGSLVFLGNNTDQVQITGAGAYNGIYTIPAANITGSGGAGTTFTFTTTGSNLASATGSAGQWLSGQNGTGIFGQKLVFSGGATGVTGNVVNPGASGYSVNLYVTGANVQGLNPNEFLSLVDSNAASAGFPSGNFTLLAVDGASGSNGGTSNANANFAGIAFVPGAVTTTALSSTGRVTYGGNVTFTATVTSPSDTPTGTVTFYFGNTLLGTGAISTVSGHQVATFTTTTPLPVGENTISAVYNPGGSSLAIDDVSIGSFAQEVDYAPSDIIVSQVGYSANIASVAVSGTTVTVTTTNTLPFASNATGLVLTIAGNSGTNVNGTYPITLLSPTSFSYTASLGTATAGTGGTVSVGSSVAVTATSVATSGGVTTVTVTTSAGSGFSTGQTVTIAGTTGGTNINGNFVLTSASGTTLKYISSGAVAATGFTGATAGSVTPLSSSATATFLDDFSNTSVKNSVNTDNLPTAIAKVTVSGASWNVSNDTITFTSATATNLQPGQLVTITGTTPTAYNATYTILSTPTTTSFTVASVTDPGAYTSGGSALVDQNGFTEGGTATTSGYLTDSVDGHSLTIAGNVQVAGGSLSGAQSDVAVIGPDGSVNDSTLISSVVGSARAVISTDGSGFWVATSSGLDFVPFGGATPSAISAASWSSANGGTATITAPNSYVAGQSVYVTGIGVATGYNDPASVNGYPNAFTVLSATSTQFTYSLPTQPTGTPTFTGATAQLAPTLISAAANNYGNSGQTPTTVTIGTGPNGNYPQLIADAGNQFQNNGEPSIDGPFTVGSGLSATGGQSIGVYGTGTAQNFPNARDRFQNFPSSAQIAVSPDGQTVFVADSRTDGLGGILEYYQAVQNSWVLLGSVQLDNYSITGASESGTMVTITTSGPTNFFVGESVAINGVALPSYNGSGNIVTSVSGNTFTFTSSFTGLSSSGAAVTGAYATGSDGGVRALAANYTGGVATLYATTSGTSGNRVIKVSGGTLDGSNASLTATVVSSAAPGTAFRGVAFAPVRAGSTASTTGVSASGNVLTATVTSGATGWVEFFQGGKYIGTALVNGGTATLDTTGILPAGAYSVTATYTGDATYAASSGTTSLTVTAISTSTSLSFNPTTASTSSSETITATIAVPSGQSPTGLVTFTNTSNSNAVLGYATVNQVIQNVNGFPVISYQAILTVAAGTFTAGTANISAVYSGDAYFATSTGTGSLSVVNGTTVTVTSSAANPSAISNQTLTLSATVTSTASGTPGGMVQFYDNTLALGTALTLSGGVATLTVPTSLVQSVTVLSASNTTNGSTTTVTITTDAAIPSALVGTLVTVEAISSSVYDGTFTVTAVSGHTFSFVDSAAQFADPDTKGGLAIFLNALTPGLHSISAVYTPSGTTFGPSTGVHQQTVQGQALTTTDIFQERLGDGITSLNTQYPNTALGSVGATNYIDEINPTTDTLIQSFILPSADSQAFSVTNAAWSGGMATLTTSSPTDYAVGQKVTVAGITGTTGTSYNGDITITAVSGNTFSYALTTQPTGTPAYAGATVTGVIHAVVGDGQQSTTGQMTLSGDGQSLFLTGYDNNPLPYGTALPVPTGTGSNAVPRSLARLNFDGSIQTEAFLSNAGTITTGINSTGIINGVYSPDGNQFYLGGNSALYYFPSFTQSASLQGSSNTNLLTSGAVNGIESYGGNLYVIAGTKIAQIGTGLPTNHVQAVTAVAWASGTATLTLGNTTGYAVGSSVQVSGITGTTGTSYNGTVTLTGVTATTISYALSTQPTGTPVLTGAVVEVLATSTQLPGFPTSPTTEPIPISSGGTDAYFTHLNGTGTALDTIYVGDRGSSFGLGAITKWSLTSVNITSITESGTTATGTLASGILGLAVGQPITLTLAGNAPAAYNGTFTITPTSATTFTFTAPSGTGTATTVGTASAFVEAPGGILYSQTAAQLGFYWLAGTTNGSTVNLYSTYGNGGNGDFGPGLTYGVLDTNGFAKSPGVAITAATWSSGTVTITAANNFQAGGTVDIEGVSPSGYNGQYTIVSASPTSFTYALSSNPGTATVTNAIATSVNTVNSVAFEGIGGGFLGSETTRGVTLAPQAMTISLVNNGPNPASPAQAITFSVTVASPGSINGPTGTLTLEDASNGNAVVPTTGNTLSGGTATLTVAAGALSSGTHNLFVVYSGDSYHQAQSSSPVSETVTAFATTTTLTDNGPNPSTQGQAVSFTVSVSGGSSISGETVQIEDASNSNAVVATPTLTSGSATFNISTLSVGTHNLFAVYTADATHLGSQSSQVSQVVNSAQATTTTTLTDNGPNPSYNNMAVSFTAAVSGGTTISGETVSIEDASNSNAVVATPTLTGGTVTFNISNLSIGAHNLFAVYAGDGTHLGSQSSQVTQTVNAIGIQLSSATYSTAEGQGSVTVTVTRAAGTDAASVQYYTTDGTAVSGTDYTGVPQGSPATINFALGQTTATISIPIADETTLRGTRNFTVTLENPGSPDVLGTPTSATVTITDPALAITGVTVTNDVVGVSFNRAANEADVHLYSSPGAAAIPGAADVTLVGNSVGSIKGSLVFDATTNLVSFVPTTGLLPADTYTLTLVSSSGLTGGATAFQSLNGQAMLGNGGTPGNYTSTFTVTANTAPVVSVPYFSRGAGQAVDLPTTANTATISTATESGTTATITTSAAHGFVAGETVVISGVSVGGYNGEFVIATVPSSTTFTFTAASSLSNGTGGSATTGNLPISITSSTAVTSATFTLTYDPTLLTIPATGGIAPSATAASAGLTHVTYTITSIDAHHSTVTVTIDNNGGTGSLTASSPTILLNVAATVPNNAQYLDKAVLTVANVVINGSITGSGVSSVNESAYLGAVKGNQSISGLDASLVAQVAASLSTGFSAYKDLDPVIIGDVQNAGSLSGLDASAIAKFAASLSVPQIPLIPSSASPAPGGADPILYIGTANDASNALTIGAGQSQTMQIRLKVTEAGGITVAALDEMLVFDPTKFSISNVTTGSLVAGFSTVPNVNNTLGFVKFVQYTTTDVNLANGADGDVVDFTLTALPGFNPGQSSVLKVAKSITYNSTNTKTDVDNDNGALLLNPAPTQDFNFDSPSGNPAVQTVAGIDATVTSTGPGGTLALSSQNVPSGSNFVEHITFTNGSVPFNLAALDDALKFDPTVLQVVSIAQGSGLTSSFSTVPNPDNTNGNIKVVQYTSADQSLAASAIIDTVDITFSFVNSNFTGSTQIDLLQSLTTNGSTLSTDVDNDNGPVALTPAPNNGPNYSVYGTATVVLNPNQPPQNHLPAATALSNVLYNPAAVAGLHTATANTLAFSGSNAITVTDSDGPGSGSSAFETTTISLMGSGSAYPVGSVTATASGSSAAESSNTTTPVSITAASWSSMNGGTATITLSGNTGYLVGQQVTIAGMTPGGYNGTFNVLTTTGGSFTFALATNPGTATAFGTATSGLAIKGNLPDLNATLASLVYTPGPGFFGTATLTVSTDDNGNSGFGGPQATTKTLGVTVVGLFISEINLNRVTTGNLANSGQYLEIFSTIPGYTIPSSVYFVGINGDKNSTGVAPGAIQDIFNLGGFTTSGTSGYLAFLEKPTSGTNPYLNAGAVTGDAVYVNSTTTSVGFGNGGTTSKFNGITNVHLGATRTGRTAENATDLELGSVSYLLIQTPTAPTIGSTIDTAGTGTPNGTVYSGWNVLDGVGILRSSNGPGGPDRSYAPITFKSTSNTTGTTIAQSNVVSTGTWTAVYVGRIASNTGQSSADWLGATLTTGGSGSYALNSSQSTAFGGLPLNNIGTANYWAPEETVLVNDGSSNQHSQVTELTVTFNTPVDIANLQGDFVVEDSNGNPVASVVTVTLGMDNGDGTASGVVAVVITFNSDTSSDTYAFSSADPFGNTRGLVDGNFFLHTTVNDITASGYALDGAHNGVPGSTSGGSGNLSGNGTAEVDEFWRLYGDSNGDRAVNATDTAALRTTYGSTGYGVANGGTGNYLWWFDYDMDGNINGTDSTQYSHRLGTTLRP